MQGKIVLEEHFSMPDTAYSVEAGAPEAWSKIHENLVDIHEKRLTDMDEYGVEVMVLSLNSPGIQAVPDTAKPIELARRANDYLAEQVAKNPDRFQAWAALPMQDPDAAARELTRCINELGFRGALVNGYSHLGIENSAVYYDLPQYWGFWETVERLDVPFYLHPRNPLPSRQQIYEGHPWFLGPAWAFGVETATHALRLMGSGLFDRYPQLNIILGHLGEGLPCSMWRVDHRIAKDPCGIKAKKTLAEYLQKNFYISTSANFRTSTLIDVMLEVGADRILFSVDYPFEGIKDGVEWFESASISETDRLKIGRSNAAGLLKLGKQIQLPLSV
jgi:predicted TIM-barrel fold metal-dependent hydrolase